MGHINLAAPVIHIWFFKSIPNRLGTILGMKNTELEKIIYFQDYVVVDPGQSALNAGQLLSEEEFREAVQKYGAQSRSHSGADIVQRTRETQDSKLKTQNYSHKPFKASMGAEAIRAMLEGLDLADVCRELRRAITKTNSKQKIKDLTKRLKTINELQNSGNKPEWMVLEAIPVIPPDLRPLVLLERDNFATSDLNDLYRRIINRNNRLKKLMDLNAPEVIIRNEKRMLQQAVDSLLDNSRCRRPVLGSNNRPLKSLTDMIKGKQGRFRENLLGKRVDYSARSVIVVGPNLKLYQCGLPKKIALELYQPFIIRKLKQHGLADTIKSAKRMIERRDEVIWDILEEVIHQHPVLLNRAPTLHRMGVQAFEPTLVEGNAIMLHPLACKGFNADFDGDQMAVHLPLSIEAQAETHILMMTTSNIFSPANGSPMVGPSQDMVMGNYYLTIMEERKTKSEKLKADSEVLRFDFYALHCFRDTFEAIMAYETGKVSLQEKIKVRIHGSTIGETPIPKQVRDRDTSVIETTVGRCIFNDMLPESMPFYNMTMSQKGLSQVISDCFKFAGRAQTVELLDRIKDLGFRYATLAGLSFGLTDLKIPTKKAEIISETEKRVGKIQKNYAEGVLTDRERYNQVIDAWTNARVAVTNEMIRGLREDTNEDGTPYLNPIYLMTDSGARGSIDQIQQLAGMRALMAKPSGEIIETPIKSNFREGLSVLEYFSSTHGARKGLADTALKTANSGYLTRKLIDVAQNVIIIERDCGTLQGITKTTVSRGEQVDIPLSQLIIGRTARDNIRNPITDEMIVRENEVITPQAAAKIEALGLDAIRVRSPLTCDSPFGVCAKCHGWDMSTGRLVEEGSAVGIIAAQSIGEPGTQLTLRTFHTGGVASRAILEREQKATYAGKVQYRDLKAVSVKRDDGSSQLVTLKRNGEIVLLDLKDRELDRFKVPYGGTILVKDRQKVKADVTLFRWDPHRTPILAEVPGLIRFVDIVEGETVQVEERVTRDEGRRPSSIVPRQSLVVIEHKGDKHPQIIIEEPPKADESIGKILDVHYLPAGARIEVSQGQNVQAGQLLAHQPRATGGTQDITGGLPRVTEVFEARKPKDPAAMAEISGRVELLSDKRKGKMTIIVRSEKKTGPKTADKEIVMEKEHHVPRDRHLNVHAGDSVEAGDALTDGPLVPHDILRIKGAEALQRYLIYEIQNVYRSQNVNINDKHIEIIISCMMRKVEIESVGDSTFLPGEVVDKFAFRRENERLANAVKIAEVGDVPKTQETRPKTKDQRPQSQVLSLGTVIDKKELSRINEKIEAIGGTPAKGKKPKPATAKTLLLGITKASLWSDSFIAAASFQETTKVLTEAALAGKIDELCGLKENVILGHLIPAGTAFKPHLEMKVKHLVEAPLPKEFREVKEIDQAEAKAEAAMKEALGIDS